jgi:hypothetical protein
MGVRDEDDQHISLKLDHLYSAALTFLQVDTQSIFKTGPDEGPHDAVLLGLLV